MAQERFDTIVGSNVQIKGNLTNQGSIELHGQVEGEITSGEDITIGETANIQGPVSAKNIDISGRVVGSIQASEKIEINPSGYVEGDIKAKIISIKPGATFNGSSTMSDTGTGLNPSDKKKPKLEVEE